MKKLIKSILKFFIPQHLRVKIRYLLNLQDHIESINEKNHQLTNNITCAQRDIQNFQEGLNDIHWEISKLKNLFLIKENSPLVFDKLKAPLVEDPFFAEIVGKNFAFPDITYLKNDFRDIARKIVIRYAYNTASVPLDTVQEQLLKLFNQEPVREYAFFYLVERIFPQYENDDRAIVLENAYQSLKYDRYIEPWHFANGILMWICFLMLRGEHEKAREVLLEKKKIIPNKDIASWLPAAYMAYENNIRSDEIYISAEVFKRFNNQRKIISEFENYLENKSIAIVGNGPHEIGTGHGEEIDNHDVIIRFNHFVINDSFKKDYGCKFNVISNDSLFEFRQDYLESDYIIFPTSIYFHYLPIKVIDNIYKNPGIKIINHDMKIRKIFQDEFNYHRPSTGIRMVYYLNNILRIKKMDIYGISINEVKNDHYYEEIKDFGFVTANFDYEHEIYKAIL